MSAISALSHDKLHTIQKPEKQIIREYRALCSALVDLAQDPQESGPTRVAAHRVIQEYIIKPLKQQYMEERKARQESKASTPHAVNIAVSNLPVGAAASVQIVNSGQNPRVQAGAQHNNPSRKEIITLTGSAILNKTQQDSPEALAPMGGEAAEKTGAALNNVVHPPHFLDISNDCDTNEQYAEYKRCLDTLRAENVQLRSELESLRSGTSTSVAWPTSGSVTVTSCGTQSSSISGEQVKTYEDAHDDRSPTIRRCPDCLALWKRDKAKKAEMGRRCLACGSDISNRHIKAVRCFRCSKARKNQQTVDWQVAKAEKAAARKKAQDANL